jgi:hypothetical protein
MALQNGLEINGCDCKRGKGKWKGEGEITEIK